jgi:hypothetical protein
MQSWYHFSSNSSSSNWSVSSGKRKLFEGFCLLMYSFIGQVLDNQMPEQICLISGLKMNGELDWQVAVEGIAQIVP